ncbi:MAG: hypothetical protein ACXW39_00245 [Nitrospira sp.]
MPAVCGNRPFTMRAMVSMLAPADATIMLTVRGCRWQLDMNEAFNQEVDDGPLIQVKPIAWA